MVLHAGGSVSVYGGVVLTHVPFIKHFGGPDGDPSEEEDDDESEVVDGVCLEGHVDLEDVAVLVNQLAEVDTEIADHSSIAEYIVHHQIGCAQTAGR